jgi:hypothetical protein
MRRASGEHRGATTTEREAFLVVGGRDKVVFLRDGDIWCFPLLGCSRKRPAEAGSTRVLFFPPRGGSLQGSEGL